MYRISMKRHTTLNVDDELLERAKDKGINVSELAEKAIKSRLGDIDVVINSVENCEFCGKEDRKSTRDDLLGLTWLYPDERWICEKCLLHKGRHIIHG